MATNTHGSPQVMCGAYKEPIPVLRQAQRYADDLIRLYRLEKQHADDLHSGALMQRRFLSPAEDVSRMLQPCGYSFAMYSQAPHAVSGDFFCSKQIASTTAGLLLADTASHNLSAALLSMRISSLIQTTPTPTPSHFLEHVHNDISGIVTSGKFVTASYAIVSPACITIANAGQPLPLLVREGISSEINASGIPLGLPLGAGQYRNIAITPVPGDKIILYTDGVSDAENPNGDKLSPRQFRNWLERYSAMGLHDQLAETLGEVRHFMGNAPFKNDISIIILEYRG